MNGLRNQALWFRNTTGMNDFSKISYGLNSIRALYSGKGVHDFVKPLRISFTALLLRQKSFFLGGSKTGGLKHKSLASPCTIQWKTKAGGSRCGGRTEIQRLS